MEKFIIIALIVIVFAILLISKTKKSPTNATETEQAPADEKIPIAGAYQKKWLLTYNEKDAYKVLFEICQKYGLFLGTKVRLFDLVEPIKGNPKYKTYMYKIQAKHVDFVICDAKLVARCIIELDDSSHKAQDRKNRDDFINEVLKSVGYKVIHIQTAEKDKLETEIKEIFKIQPSTTEKSTS